MTDSIRDILRRAVFPDDVRQAKRDGAGCLYFGGNGVPLTQAWVSVEDELRYVRVFHQLGIRMMHVTYNRRNRLGDGCAEPANGGLSDFGRAAVDELNRVGVIVDVAHSGWQTSLEAAQRSSKPMIASHSTCGALYEHIRSKPDNVIRAIADTGGYIGICCIPRFLRHGGGITALLDHIDHVVKKFGPDHAAIGTDVAYQSRHTAREAAKLPERPRRRTSMGRPMAARRLQDHRPHEAIHGLDQLAILHRRPRSERSFRCGDSEDHRSERLAGPGSEPGGLTKVTHGRHSAPWDLSRLFPPPGLRLVRDGC